MKYLTTYMLQQEGESSLLLQQYTCRGIPVCFACLCTCGEKTQEAGRYVTGQLLAWSHDFPWHKAVRRPKKWMEQAGRELEKSIGKSLEKMGYGSVETYEGEVSWQVLLCMGEELLMMGNGQGAYLLSMSLGRGSVKRLQGSFRGILESGAGILLTAEGPVRQEEEKKLGEILQLSGLETEEQMNRHLREYIQSSPGNIRTAIMLLTKEEGYE